METVVVMKKGIVTCITVLILSILVSCGQKKPATGSEAADPIVNGSDAPKDNTAEGKRLIQLSDCMGCHMIDKKVTGPAFLDIAKRYGDVPGIEANLAHSIITGSKAEWYPNVTMPAHNNVSYPDAVKMAQYIISLKGKAVRDSLNAVK